MMQKAGLFLRCLLRQPIRHRCGSSRSRPAVAHHDNTRCLWGPGLSGGDRRPRLGTSRSRGSRDVQVAAVVRVEAMRQRDRLPDGDLFAMPHLPRRAHPSASRRAWAAVTSVCPAPRPGSRSTPAVKNRRAAMRRRRWHRLQKISPSIRCHHCSLFFLGHLSRRTRKFRGNKVDRKGIIQSIYKMPRLQ
jgi:hypothetical protein